MEVRQTRLGKRGTVSFKERDAVRLMKAVRAAGYRVVGVEVNITGNTTTLRVLTGAADKDRNDTVNPWDNPWDEALINAANEKRPS